MKYNHVIFQSSIIIS